VTKLNVIAVTRRVLLLLFDFGFLIRATGIWFVVIAMADLIEFLLVASGAVPALNTLASISNWIVRELALAACAVTVHRSILLRESPFRLRLGRTEICYILRGIVVWLPLVVPLMLVVVISVSTKSVTTAQIEELTATPVAWVITWTALNVLTAIVVLPFALSLPALAIGNPEFEPGDGLDVSFRNIPREIATYLLAFSAPAAVLGLLALGVTKPLALLGSWSGPIAYATNLLVTLLDTVLWAAVLSCTYAALVRRDPEFTTRPAEP
jgi:hypothetical protein